MRAILSLLKSASPIVFGLLFIAGGAGKIISGMYDQPPERSALTVVTGAVRTAAKSSSAQLGGIIFYELKVEPSNSPGTMLTVTLTPLDLDAIQINENDTSANKLRFQQAAAPKSATEQVWDKKVLLLVGLPATALIMGDLKQEKPGPRIWDLTVGKYKLAEYEKHREGYVRELVRKKDDGPGLLIVGVLILIGGLIWAYVRYQLGKAFTR